MSITLVLRGRPRGAPRDVVGRDRESFTVMSTLGEHSLHCAVEFQALPSRIGQVRRIVAAQLRYWRLPQLVDPATLGVSELLANIHRHGSADKHCTVRLALLRGRLTVSVLDQDPRLPEVRSAARTATSGRGLALVASVSTGWGMRTRRDGGGKIVWFTLPALPGPDAPRAAASPAPAGVRRAVPPAVPPRAPARAPRARAGHAA